MKVSYFAQMDLVNAIKRESIVKVSCHISPDAVWGNHTLSVSIVEETTDGMGETKINSLVPVWDCTTDKDHIPTYTVRSMNEAIEEASQFLQVVMEAFKAGKDAGTIETKTAMLKGEIELDTLLQ